MTAATSYIVAAIAAFAGCAPPPSVLTESVSDGGGSTASSDASLSGAAADATSLADAAPAFDASSADSGAIAPVCEGGPPTGSACGGCGVVECDSTGLHCASPADTAVDIAGCQAFEPSFSFDVDTSLGLTVHGGGLAFGDVDGDGDSDGVFAGPDKLRLYKGDGAGGFAEASSAFLLSPRKVAAVTMVDYDADGDLDVFVTAEEPTPGLHLYRNDGTGAFEDVTASMAFPTTSFPRGIAWGDYDGDGWLDAYVASYYDAPSLLLRNINGEGFEDVAPAYGLSNPLHAQFQPVWFDVDTDGDLDLFVTVDRGSIFGIPPQLYRNDGPGGFVPIGNESGFTELIDGMGVAVGDVDGDGDFDLYVTNIGWNSGEGQMLYINNGDGTFTTSSLAWGAEVTDRVGWGTELFDYDNDGDVDLAVAAQPTSQSWFGENWGGGFFDLSSSVGLPAQPQNGLATADFDGDGKLDIGWLSKEIPVSGDPTVVVGAELFRNVVPSSGHWLRLELSGAAPNLRGIGATVTAWVGSKPHMRLVGAGGSYLSASDSIVHIGLGTSDAITALEVRWPDGTTTSLPGPIEADRRLLVSREGIVLSPF